MQHMVVDVFSNGGFGSVPPGIQQLMGVQPNTSRWQDWEIAVREAGQVLAQHCRSNRDASDMFCKPDGAFQLAGEHENAWAKCFNEHDYVRKSSERAGYQACLAASDPMVKVCAQERKEGTLAQPCPGVVVNYADIDSLRSYRDRWVTDPNRLPALATLVGGQAEHITLLEAVLAPTPPNSMAQRLTGSVRGRLENSLEGTTKGETGRAVLIPAGTEVVVDFSLSQEQGSKASSLLDMQTTAAHLSNGKNGQLYSQNIYKHLAGWPEAGTVLMPANTSLSFATRCGCVYPMSLAEFRKRVEANTGSPANVAKATELGGAILAGSRMQTVLLEPINVSGIEANKLFHAQLNVDMELPRGTRRDDAIKLARGTDVYLKVIDHNAGGALGHTANLTVEYVVFKGKKIYLRTPAWPHTFSAQILRFPNSRRGPPQAAADSVVWPSGDTKWFDISEQAEVSQDAGGEDTPPEQTPATQAGHDVAAPATGAYGNAAIHSGEPASPPQHNQPVIAVRDSDGRAIAGTYTGTYMCRQGTTGLQLEVDTSDGIAATAVFKAKIPNLPAYDLSGTYNSSTHELVLNPVKWEGPASRGYTMVGLQGSFDPMARTLKGRVMNGSCQTFQLVSVER
jgi:hypothetical protein